MKRDMMLGVVAGAVLVCLMGAMQQMQSVGRFQIVTVTCPWATFEVDANNIMLKPQPPPDERPTVLLLDTATGETRRLSAISGVRVTKEGPENLEVTSWTAPFTFRSKGQPSLSK